MTREHWNMCETYALEVFRYGQKVCAEKGLILVDTKYEFGYDSNNNIILIDEIHTGDSSRYWLKNTYAQKFQNQQSPDKMDKDAVRDYMKKEET